MNADARGERCGAMCRDGSACRSWPLKWSSRCRMHGGASPRSREAATRRELAHRADVVLDTLDVEPLANPVDALLQVAGEVVAVKDWLAERFAEADADTQYVLAEMLGRALDRASRLLVEIHRLDLEPRRQAIEEGRVLQIVDVIAGTLADCGVDPTAPHVGKTLRRHLERVDDDGYVMRHKEYWGARVRAAAGGDS